VSVRRAATMGICTVLALGTATNAYAEESDHDEPRSAEANFPSAPQPTRALHLPLSARSARFGGRWTR